MSPPTLSTTMNTRQWLTLLSLSVLWGGTFFAVAIALTELPPILIVWLRLVLAALALLSFVWVKGYVLPREPHVYRAFFTVGLLNNVLPFSLMFWAQTVISSSLTSILNASTPIFAVVVGGLLLRDEPFTRPRLFGAVIGIFGVAIMVGPGALHGFGIQLGAELAVLAGTFSYAFAGVYGRRFSAWGIAPPVIAAGQLSASTLIAIPAVLAFGLPETLTMPGLPVVLAILSLALLSTALAYILYFKILASAGATNLSLVTLLIPVTAILLGTIFLNERLTANHIAGVVIIALGLSVIDGRLWRKMLG